MSGSFHFSYFGKSDPKKKKAAVLCKNPHFVWKWRLIFSFFGFKCLRCKGFRSNTRILKCFFQVLRVGFPVLHTVGLENSSFFSKNLILSLFFYRWILFTATISYFMLINFLCLQKLLDLFYQWKYGKNQQKSRIEEQKIIL